MTPPEAKNRNTELLQLQISKEYVDSGRIECRVSGDVLGTIGYVQGNNEGKPETYVYIRYRTENGDIIDRLIPRDKVRLRDDLEPNATATIDLEIIKTHEATYEDIQKDPKLCYDVKPDHKTKSYHPKIVVYTLGTQNPSGCLPLKIRL